MTEETAWVIEEQNTEGGSEWYSYPSIKDRHEVDDMEPTTLEECLTYLRDDPFDERSNKLASIWLVRIRNLITGEEIIHSAL